MGYPALDQGAGAGGADVVPTGRRLSLVHDAVYEITKMGRKALGMDCDVCDRASLEALRNRVIEEFGKVDILVNCAGITQRTPALDQDEAEWNRILDTNLNGTARTCQIFGRTMVDRQYGRIINIASLTSEVAFFEVAAYSASKAAVASLTKSLAVEWARYGVCVNAPVPGVFRTDLSAALLDGTGRGQECLMRTLCSGLAN